MDVILVEAPQPDSPYGIKGVGEIGLVPTAGAVAEAMRQVDGQWRTHLPINTHQPVSPADVSPPVPGAGPGAAPDPAGLAEPDPGTAARTTPGMVCAHHHLYSALARGMPAPPRTPTEFLEILELVWWRLDRALDLDIIEWSAKLGALEALESGTTAIIDHHESPNAIDGVAGRDRGGLCRGGREGGLRLRGDRPPRIGGRPGRAGRERPVPAGRGPGPCGGCTPPSPAPTTRWRPPPGWPPTTAPASTSMSARAGPISRPAPAWSRWPRDDWLVIHAVHLDRDLPGVIVHNPRSNMNNAVGYARPRGPAQPGGARHRRDRRGHARRVPGGLRTPPRGRRDRHPRDGLGLAGDRLAAVPRGPRRHGGLVV